MSRRALLINPPPARYLEMRLARPWSRLADLARPWGRLHVKAVGRSLYYASQWEAGIRKRRDMQSNTNSSVQVECLWSQSLGQGSNCTNSLDPNATSVNSNGDLVLFEIIASVLEGKDLGEDLEVRNTILPLKATNCKKKVICRKGMRSKMVSLE